MFSRQELISSKEFWIELISSRIWFNKKLKISECDELARKIVDAKFMEIINELKK